MALKSNKIDKKVLSKVFNDFATKAIQDFPHLKDKFVLFSFTADTWFINLKNSRKAKEVTEYFLSNVNEAMHYDNFNLAAVAYRDAGYHVIAHTGNFKDRTTTKISEPYDDELKKILEHDLGHLVAPEGFYLIKNHGYNFSESIADSFSLVRQIQDGKNIKDSLDVMMLNRSMELVLLGVSDNFTMPVLQELKNLSNKHDLSKTTPNEAANVAYRLSLKYSYSERKLKNILKIFEPVKDIYETDYAKQALKKCAEVMFEDHAKLSDDIFEIGKSILLPVLNEEKEFLTLNRNIKYKLRGKFWNEVREKIKIRDKEIAKKNMRRGFKRNLDHLQVLGVFDRKTSKIINPETYLSVKNKVYIKKKREVYKMKLNKLAK